MAPATPRHQCIFDAAALDVVHDLVRSHPCAGTKADELLHIGEIEIAHAPVADFAGTQERAECLKGLEERNFLPPVQEIEVKPVRLEPSQAALACCNRAAACGVLRQNFADQKYLVTPPGDCLRYNFFGAAVRIGPDLRMAVVGAPSYFKKRPEPRKPQDLTGHDCINLRLLTHGGLYAWEFEKDGRELKVRVDGQLTFNGTSQMLNGALAGFGLAYVPEDLAQPYISKGRLRRVLADWCQPYSGYHLYFPSRRQSSAAFALLVDALRYRD